MAVKLRLMRMGKKKQPTYRIVAADSHSPRDGRFIEVLGTYAPRAEPSAITIDADKAVDWLQKGAQPTETVRKLLEISGAWATYSSRRGGSPAAAPSAAAQSAAAPSAATATTPAPAAVATEPASPAGDTAGAE